MKNTLPEREAFIIPTVKNLFYHQLVKNAIKFTERTIELGYTLKSEKDSSVLEFYVKDMGIGIPKK
jgi:K+-sensing histidine kinase KdpD